MIDMIKQYKHLRYKIKLSKWGIKLDGVDEISHKDCKLQIGKCKIGKKFVFKCCPQYYKYKQLFYDNLKVNLDTFI